MLCCLLEFFLLKSKRAVITLPHGILTVGAGISCSGRAPLLLAMCTTFTECYFVPVYTPPVMCTVCWAL